MEIISLIKNSLDSKYLQKVSRHLTLALYFLLGVLILQNSSGKGEFLNVYLLTFLIWAVSNIFFPIKEKLITIIGLIFLFCTPFLIILKINHIIIEDFVIYVFEILILSVIQEVFSFFNIRRYLFNIKKYIFRIGRKLLFSIPGFFDRIEKRINQVLENV